MLTQVKEENSLGWNLNSLQEENAKTLETGQFFSIASMAGGKKRYCLTCLRRLSCQEQRLLCKCQDLFQKSGKTRKQQLRKFFKSYCVQNLIMLERKQVEYLLPVLEKQLFGFGPLDFVLADDAIEEIAVIGIGKGKPVYVFHNRHGWLQTNLFFSSSDYVKELANKMSRSLGRRLSMNSPVLNATLPDGSRLNAAINPVCFSGPSLTIRRFKQKPFTPAQLVENKTFSADLMAFLWIAMQCDCNLLIAGNTGSGKTSSLNALLSFVPASERIVVVEETPEIRLQHSHFVKLNVVKEQEIGMLNLIVESLRMRPDRIVVGEVRSREEVGAFIDTMLAGQGKGSYATFHGQSINEAINRMSFQGINAIDLAAIDLILVQKRWNIVGRQGNKEVRRVVEVGELPEGKGKLHCNSLFKYNYAKDKLTQVNESSRVFEKATRSFLFDKKGFRKELLKRSRFLSKLPGNMQMQQFFNKVNNY